MSSKKRKVFDGDSHLHIAVRQGLVETVRKVLEQQQVNVNILNTRHETPLYLACSQRATAKIVQLLIAFGADPYIRVNDKTAYNKSSYDIAALMNKLLYHHDLWINGPTQTDVCGDTPLHNAIRHGKVDDIQRIIQKSKETNDILQILKCSIVNSINACHETPLHIACALGHKHIVHILISHGADLYKRDCYNNAPVHRAVSQGHVDILDYLISHCTCDPNIKGYQGRTLLHFACAIGKISLVSTLIEKHGINPVATDAVNQTPLHIAASHGQEEVVCLLITKYNSPIDCQSNHKLSALHLACYCGHVSVVKTLVLKYKARVDALDEEGSTPFMKAVMGGNLDLVQMMITDFDINPPSVTDDSGHTPLHLSCWGGHEKLARLFITKYNFHVDIQDKSNVTPLHSACLSGHINIVRMLVLEYNSSIDVLDIQGSAPLHFAALNGHASMIKILVSELGCNSQVKGVEGKSLLHYACSGGMTDLVRTLITDFNLDPLLVDDNGDTPLHMACFCGHEKVARLLMCIYSCSVDITNKNKQTPLHKACQSGHSSAVIMLISEFKANLMVQDCKNDMPIDKAAQGGHVDVVQMLITEFGWRPYVKGFKSKSLLHLLSAGGCTTILKVLISNFNNYNPALIDENGNTLLHTAAHYGKYEVVDFLIASHSNHCPTNHQNFKGQTPLHCACIEGHTKVALLLVKNNASLTIRDKGNHTPLQKAYFFNKFDIFFKIFNSNSHKLDTKLLHEVCERGSFDLVNMLLSDFKLDPSSVLDKQGNRMLHVAAACGHKQIVTLVINKYECSVNSTNFNGQTPLHLLCSQPPNENVNALIHFFVTELKADVTSRDKNGQTPLHLLCSQTPTERTEGLIRLFVTELKANVTSSDKVGQNPLHLLCSQTPTERTEGLLRLIVTELKADVTSRDENGQTPLHLLCSLMPNKNHHALIKTLITEFKADITSKDNNGDEPIHKAAQFGFTSTVISLILDHRCSPKVRGFKQRTLLHHALAKGHTSTAKTLLDDFHLSLHWMDDDGNTPLHLSSLYGQPESIRFLLYDYHAHLYVRNKAGKTALDVAEDDVTKKIFREYVISKHNSIQQEYEELQTKSLQKYCGQQIIIRLFVLGNSGSGKSTLVQSLKQKGLRYYFDVPETEVPSHTAGIVPSICQSKDVGRLLYYDFAGDKEYYSSHAAILEVVSHSSVGSSIYLIVIDLRKAIERIFNEVGYWLSFISYHGKALKSKCTLEVLIILSHSDCVDLTNSIGKVEKTKHYLDTQMNQCNEVMFNIVGVISSNCRSPRSSKSIESVLQQIYNTTIPHNISYEASLLHGILEKDFGNVVACKFQDLISSIKDTGIYLPTSADVLYPVVKELHDIGLLMMIGKSEDQIENHLIIMDIPSLTNKVHEMLFSKSAKQKFSSAVSSQYAKMGIFPESFISSILPHHITKECLVQLQYCQEFNHAEVGLDYSITQKTDSNNLLLHFPALCQLESEHANWPHDPNLNFSIGWFAECTGKLNFFPPRYLHVLLLRLTFMFALPASTTPTSDLNLSICLQDQNCLCTMWKKGIHWLMREGVECVVEVVNENKGVVVVVKSRKQHTYQCIHMLTQIANIVTEAKTEFCKSVPLRHYILNSDDPLSYKNEDKLYDVSVIKSDMESKKETIVSVSGRQTLILETLKPIKCHTSWGMFAC